MIVKKQFFSLFFIYSSIWFLSVLFLPFFSEILNYNVSDNTINFLIFHSIFGLIVYLLTIRKKTFSNKNYEEISWSYLKRVRQLIVFSFFLTIIFAANILRNYSDLLISSPWELRRMYFEGEVNVYPSLSYTIMFIYTTAIVGSSIVYFKKDQGRKIYYLPIFTSLIFAIVYVGRNEFLKVTLIYFIAVLFKNHRFSFIKVLKRLSLIFAVLLIMSSILNKGGNLTDNSSNVFAKTMINISSYGTGSLLAFDMFINRSYKEELGLGEYTFYPIFRRLSSIGLYKENFEISYVDDFEMFINTFTYLRPFYSDFGMFGVYIMSSVFLFLIIYFTQINSQPKSLKIYFIFISLFPAVLFSVQGLEYQTMEFFTAIIIALLINFFTKIKFQ